MSWTKLGDEFPDDCADLSSAAFRTHVEALCWSNKRLLDLVIPKRDLRRFAFDPDAELAAKELAAAGWWQDTGDGWFIGMRFPEWQRDRVQVVHARERGAEKKRRQRRHALGEHDLCSSTNCPDKACPPGTPPGDSLRDPGTGTGRDGKPNYGKQLRVPWRSRTGRRRDSGGPTMDVLASARPALGAVFPADLTTARTSRRTSAAGAQRLRAACRRSWLACAAGTAGWHAHPLITYQGSRP